MTTFYPLQHLIRPQTFALFFYCTPTYPYNTRKQPRLIPHPVLILTADFLALLLYYTSATRLYTIPHTRSVPTCL